MNPLSAADYAIRIATRSDGAALQGLINAAFVTERRLKKGQTDRLEETGEELNQLMESGVFLTHEKNGILSATVYLAIKRDRCYLGLLSVAPSEQGKGLARVMLAEAESYARKHECRWMDLRVVSPRALELVPLYCRLGFTEEGREEYPEDLVPKMAEAGYFICMTKRIEPS